jgi:hypothetical protein
MNLRGGSGKLPAKLRHLPVTAPDQRAVDLRHADLVIALQPRGTSHPDREQQS